MPLLRFLLFPPIRLLLSVGGLLAIAYVAVCLFLLVRQNRFIFFPSKTVESTPAEAGLSYQDVWLPIGNSTQAGRIHSWWLPSQHHRSLKPQDRVLIYLHGNSGNVGDNIWHAKRFHQLGFSVFLVDYRGYGLSEGEFPTETQVYQDAEVAWNYLTQQQQVLPEQIFLYGHSLGGAIAIDLAVRQPQAAGLIVQGSFTSIREMADWTGGYDLIPIDLVLNQRFDSINKVKSLQMPVFFIHGINDDAVPSHMSQTLHAVAPEPKQLWLVPEAGHVNVADVAGPEYLEMVQQFVENVESNRTANQPFSQANRSLAARFTPGRVF
ncbi:MAG: alpha/beta hydrolase [Cyanothece sp. SIO1E1]|nr:alpha/beta hydrolase [Cyanothece sp. SIO1E1]